MRGTVLYRASSSYYFQSFYCHQADSTLTLFSFLSLSSTVGMAHMDVATARARMARRAEAVKKYIGELKDAIEEKDLSMVEMRWINDVSGCLVSERERFGDLAEVVLDEEVDEDLMQKDAVSIAEFKTSVQSALSQATVCHSMKALDIATQLLETNLRRLEQHFDLDPEKNYAASLKLCCQLQDSLVVTIGTFLPER